MLFCKAQIRCLLFCCCVLFVDDQEERESEEDRDQNGQLVLRRIDCEGPGSKGRKYDAGLQMCYALGLCVVDRSSSPIKPDCHRSRY